MIIFIFGSSNNIAISRLRKITIDELLQSIILQHYLHPILPGYVIWDPINGILQSQPIEGHFNVYSTSAPRIFCCKFKLFTNTKSLRNCNIQELTMLWYHVEIIYIKNAYVLYSLDLTIFNFLQNTESFHY